MALFPKFNYTFTAPGGYTLTTPDAWHITGAGGGGGCDPEPAGKFAVQRPTRDGIKFFPQDTTDPAAAQRFETFSQARKARDEGPEVWRCNGQIVEAEAVKAAPVKVTRWAAVSMDPRHGGFITSALTTSHDATRAKVFSSKAEAEEFTKVLSNIMIVELT